VSASMSFCLYCCLLWIAGTSDLLVQGLGAVVAPSGKLHSIINHVILVGRACRSIFIIQAYDISSMYADIHETWVAYNVIGSHNTIILIFNTLPLLIPV
jgi:hypothetical protein